MTYSIIVASYEEQKGSIAAHSRTRALRDLAKGAKQLVIDPLAVYELHRKLQSIPKTTLRSECNAIADLDLLKSIFANRRVETSRAIRNLPATYLENVMAFARASNSRYWAALPSENKKAIQNRLLYRPPVNNLRSQTPITTFGTEFEIFGLSKVQLSFVQNAAAKLDERWISDEDGSIEPNDFTSGREIISPPYAGNELNQIFHVSVMLDAMKAKTDLPCAFHVHAGIKNTFPKDTRFPLMKQILVNYLPIEQALSAEVGTGRMDELQYLTDDYPSNSYFPNSILHLRDVESAFIEGANFNGRRYSKINFESLTNYGTIEFRQHPGTVQPAKVTAWIGFVNEFMKASLDMVRERGAHLPSDNERENLDRLVERLSQRRGLNHRERQPFLAAAAGTVQASPQLAI